MHSITLILLLLSVALARAAEITVSAAASLTDVLTEVGKVYEQRTSIAVRLNTGASGALQQQIEQGAPVDVFVSASPMEMDALQAKGLIDAATRVNVARNALVIIAPKGSAPIEWSALQSVRRLAIGDPRTVPAGRYAMDVMYNLKIRDAMNDRFIYAENVRQVLAYVSGGNVDAGIVYATDVGENANVVVSTHAPTNLQPTIEYPASVIARSAQRDQAAAFVKYLALPEAQEVFAKFGFVRALH
jgi:molybdate transport system substrate-binding protein